MNRKPGRRRSTAAGEHVPVLLDQVLEVLAPKPGEVAVDCTLGLGGHGLALLERVGAGGRLVGIDLDSSNLPLARERLAATGHPFSLHHGNFAALPAILANEGLKGADLLIADLGASSPQLDQPERGFSYVRGGPLDMRMDQSRGQTAADLLAVISRQELERALAELADEPAAAAIARTIVERRREAPPTRTEELAGWIADAVGQPVRRDQGWRLHPRRGTWNLNPAARTFQALRILVNRELANLAELLRVLPLCLHPGGRAAIISFHSGEDRLVKRHFRSELLAGSYREVSAEPLRAGGPERLQNPRARSAKLRWGKR